jgi:predicted TIM-barrel fold metal-dependent hydrolase
MTDTKQPLSEDPTLSELFEFYREEGMVRVVPMTVKEDPADTRLLLLVQGDVETASVIFAQVYSAVTDLADLQAQQEAANESRIITR